MCDILRVCAVSDEDEFPIHKADRWTRVRRIRNRHCVRAVFYFLLVHGHPLLHRVY
jgi:hypothetical protein